MTRSRVCLTIHRIQALYILYHLQFEPVYFNKLPLYITLDPFHTGLICFRSFQNYAFRGWLSLETMKLWLFVLKKNTIFNDLHYKADIGQHFHKSEKSARWRHRHKIIKTNLKTHISPLLTRPQGSQGCQKMRQDPLNMVVEVWCAKIALKLKNIQKYLRKHGFF